MTALPPDLHPSKTQARDQFIVGYGKSGALGIFSCEERLILRRGTRVLVKTARGTEVGEVLGPASIQARLLGAVSSGTLIRVLDGNEEARNRDHRSLENAIFDAARSGTQPGSSLVILDVELLYDGTIAILQFVGDESQTEKLARSLELQFNLTIRFENLAVPAPHEEHHHCEKPDCGRDNGGCSTCSTGGGCSSCGSSKVDMREYFSHLRTKMESRIPLT